MLRYHWRTICAAAALVACASGALRAGAAGLEDLANWRARLFDSVVETTDKRFFDPARLRRVDWQARAAAVRPSVLAASTDADAIRQINTLLGELKTSHTALLTPDEYLYYFILDIVGGGGADPLARRFWGNDPYYPGTGAFTREVDGRHFVDAVLEGSPAAAAGMKFGDEILSVDGEPYTPIAVFRSKMGRTVPLEIRRHADAAPQRLDVGVTPIRPVRAFAQATAASARLIEANGRRIGYIHLWAVNESEGFHAALSAFDPARGRLADGRGTPLDFLIIDARGRVGGNSGTAAQILDYLDIGGRSYWGRSRFVDRSIDERVRTGNPPFRGRSALLIDSSTRSAGEILAFGFQRSGFGPLIGTPTAGAVASGAIFTMPGDLVLYLAVSGLYFDDKYLDGVGVAPDRRVERPLPYANGADPVLDAAVELAARQAGEPHSK